MDALLLLNLVWILKISAWVILFGSALRFGLISRYRLVFGYIFWTLANSILMPVAESRLSALAYGYFYFASSLLTIGFASIVVLNIYFRFGPFIWRHDFHLLVVPLAIALAGFMDNRALWLPARLTNIGYAVLTYLSAVSLFRMLRTGQIDLGWNLRMVLLALTVPSGLFTCTFMGYAIGLPISMKRQTSGYRPQPSPSGSS